LSVVDVLMMYKKVDRRAVGERALPSSRRGEGTFLLWFLTIDGRRWVARTATI